MPGWLVFEGFTAETVDVGGIPLFVRRAGEGPPVVLLHGYAQHRVCWHRVAPEATTAALTAFVGAGWPPGGGGHQGALS